MQKQNACVFKFVRSNGKEKLHVITVCAESTRSKKLIIKTRDDWDSAAVSRFVPEDVIRNEGYSDACYYFWDCMNYSVLLAICDDGYFEDEVSDAKMEDFVTSIPVPTYDRYRGENKADYTFEYFDFLVKAFPQLKIQFLRY